jgi:hypothetical protein
MQQEETAVEKDTERETKMPRGSESDLWGS